jgi:hypothetical protein
MLCVILESTLTPMKPEKERERESGDPTKATAWHVRIYSGPELWSLAWAFMNGVLDSWWSVSFVSLAYKGRGICIYWLIESRINWKDNFSSSRARGFNGNLRQKGTHSSNLEVQNCLSTCFKADENQESYIKMPDEACSWTGWYLKNRFLLHR